MCFGRKKQSASAPAPATTAIVASTESPEAMRAGNLEERIRRRRAGAAANVLTSQMGIPFTGTTSAAKTGETVA